MQLLMYFIFFYYTLRLKKLFKYKTLFKTKFLRKLSSI